MATDPESLLHSLGVTEPEEIDVIAIAKSCGVDVKFSDLDCCAASIIGDDQEGTITVKNDPNPRRQRFSIAHELGHWAWDCGKAYRCQERDMSTPWSKYTDPEARANKYAAELLMPKHLFWPLAKTLPITLKTVISLSDEFQTSKTATAIRLVILDLKPSMVVFSTNGSWSGFIESKSVPKQFFPRKQLSKKTAASSLIQSGDSEINALDVQTDEWFTDHPSSDDYVTESAWKVGDNKVVSLIWWDDEGQLTRSNSSQGW